MKNIQKSVPVDGLTKAIESCFQMTARNMPTQIQTGVAILIARLVSTSDWLFIFIRIY